MVSQPVKGKWLGGLMNTKEVLDNGAWHACHATRSSAVHCPCRRIVRNSCGGRQCQPPKANRRHEEPKRMSRLVLFGLFGEWSKSRNPQKDSRASSAE